MAVSGIIFQMITLFIMMFAGYVSRTGGLISPSFRRGLSLVLLEHGVPCCIVSSVLAKRRRAGRHGRRPGRKRRVLRAADCAGGGARAHRAHAEGRAQPLDQLLLVFTNLAFMGIPIIQALYGVEGVAMLSMFLLVFNFSCSPTASCCSMAAATSTSGSWSTPVWSPR